MATSFPKYPSTIFVEATDLAVFASNQLYDFVNGDINTEIEVEEGGVIPSVAKALNEASAYKTPIVWNNGDVQADLMQPRDYQGVVYVPRKVPVTLGASPVLGSGGDWRYFGDAILRQELVQPVATYNSVADMKADGSLIVGRKVRTLGYYTPGDGGGNDYEIVAAGTGTDDGCSYIDLAGSGLQAKLLGTDSIVTIPTDYPDLKTAIGALSKSNLLTHHKVNVVIESGHVITTGYRVENKDCSFITISSVDPIVGVSPTIETFSDTDLDPGVPRESGIALLHIRSKAPKIDTIFDFSGTSSVNTGYKLDHNSEGVFTAGKGIRGVNNGVGGVNVRVTSGSTLHSYQGDFSAGGEIGVAVTVNSRAGLAEANCSSAGLTGLDISRGSIVYANQIDVSNAQRGIYCRRSWVSCQLANFSNCSLVGLWAAIGSRAAAADSVFDGAAKDIQVDGGSIVDASNSTKSSSPISVSNSTGVDNFNSVSGRGLITNESSISVDNSFLTAQTTPLTVTGGNLFSVPSLSYHTILDITGAKTLSSGSIYSVDCGVRITVDGVVVLNDIQRNIGQDGVGNNYSVVNLPQVKSQSSLKVELYNRSSASQNFGWKLYHN